MPFQLNVPPPDPSLGVAFGADPAADILRRGAQAGFDVLGQTGRQVNNIFNQGIGGLQPFQGTGGQANSLSAAFSGALGPEAQAQAFNNFQDSPGVNFLREEGERAILRNASATGGLGGGNVLRELNRYGQGVALQSLGDQIGLLESQANRGLSAAGTSAQLRGNQATAIAGLGSRAADIPVQAGRDIADIRLNAGNNLANQISNTTSNLANLIEAQGSGTAQFMGVGVDQVNQLIQLAHQGDAGAQEQLATLLVSLGQGGAGQNAGLPIIGGPQTNTLGQLASLAGGVGGILENLPQQTADTQTNS